MFQPVFCVKLYTYFIVYNIYSHVIKVFGKTLGNCSAMFFFDSHAFIFLINVDVADLLSSQSEHILSCNLYVTGYCYFLDQKSEEVASNVFFFSIIYSA